MPVFISMLRGVNVGGHNVIKMDALRELYASLKFEKPKTFIAKRKRDLPHRHCR